jgi:hypothetical protein
VPLAFVVAVVMRTPQIAILAPWELFPHLLLLFRPVDRAGVPDLSVSGNKFDLMEVDPHDPTMTSEPEAPMQSLNQLPVVTDLVGARSA